MDSNLPPIIIDTREQLPYDFGGHPSYIRTLKTGDYSLEGLENLVVIERKRHEEFIGCLGNDRERFQNEIERGSTFRRLHVVVEASLWSVINCRYDGYPSAMHPNAIRGTIFAWENRYDWLRFWFPGDRETAQIMAEGLLRRAWLDLVGKKQKEEQKK